jgi:hypothetical protein
MVVVAMLAIPAVASADFTVNVGQGTEPWLGWMNVAELDGTPLWGSPWGIPDLSATFDDPGNTLTLGAAPMGDPASYWYQGDPNDPAPGGPGVPGNKLMEANLYLEFSDDSLAGQTMTFEGEVLSNTLDPEWEAYLFIKDFEPDFSSFIETKIPIVPGPFSFSATLDPGLGRHVQYGTQVIGANVWPTDLDLVGYAVIGTIPEPASLVLLALGGLALARRR